MSVVSDLFVEDPLVDLDPLQTGDLHGLLALSMIKLSVS